VLPNSHDRPTFAAKSSVHGPVTPKVSLELCSPVFDVALGRGCVPRATVPEAAVDEHYQSASPKCEVGTNDASTLFLRSTQLKAEGNVSPPALHMRHFHCSDQCQFSGLVVLASYGAHYL
jgi:hypothetical protein